MTELEKIKYHIRLLNDRLRSIDGEIDLDFHSDPISSLVIEMDWSEDDKKKCAIFFINTVSSFAKTNNMLIGQHFNMTSATLLV